jgi:hypothetical protein
MKSYIFLFLFVLTPVLQVCSQNLTEDFNLLMPETKVKSVYSKLVVIDARIDTTNVGIIQKGAFNRKAFLKAVIPLKNQVQGVFKEMIESEPESKNELVLNIRDFKFAEITGALSETGYCYLRADLFSKKDTVYQKIDSVDAVYEVNAMDVTKKNIRNGSNKLIDFISSNVKYLKSGPNYSFDDILNITAVEKRKIPVYNTTSYKDGIYQSYDNFKKMSPSSSPFELTRNKKGKITKLERIWNEGASRAEVKSSDIYCVVQEGKIYIASEYGFAPVEFKNDEFYFQGKAKTTAKTGNVILATAFFGIIGGLIASDASAQFEMKIDHLNGTPILLKQIDK